MLLFIKNNKYKKVINNEFFMKAILKIPDIAIIIYYCIASLIYIRDNLMIVDNSNVNLMLFIFIVVFSLVFVYSIILSIYIGIAMNIKIKNIIIYIPTIYIFTLLRAVYFMLSSFKKYDEYKDDEFIKLTYKITFNYIFSFMNDFSIKYSNHDIYFSILYSIIKMKPSMYSLKKSKTYRTSNIFKSHFKNVPFMRLIIPYLGIILYISYNIQNITNSFIVMICMFSCFLVDLISIPIYYYLMKNGHTL